MGGLIDDEAIEDSPPSPQPSTPVLGGPDRDAIESMMLELQAGRVAFMSAVMRLRYVPVYEQKRVLRRAVIAFVRLQRLNVAAAEVLTAAS